MAAHQLVHIGGVVGYGGVDLGDEALLQRRWHRPVLGDDDIAARDMAPAVRLADHQVGVDADRLIRVLGVQVRTNVGTDITASDLSWGSS